MSPKKEREIVKACEEAAKLASEGMDPSSALAKVASNKGYNADLVHRMAEVFNNSKSLAVMKKTAGEDRLVNFSLADPKKVLSIMYPSKNEKVASAVLDDGEEYTYRERTNFKKLAQREPQSIKMVDDYTDLPRDHNLVLRKAYTAVTKLAKAESDKKINYVHYKLAYAKTISDTVTYFKKLSHQPFETFEKNALATWGDAIKPFIDTVYKQGNLKAYGEKRYTGELTKVASNCGNQPLSFMRDIIKANTEFVKAAEEYVETKKLHAETKIRVNKLAGMLTAGPVVAGSLSKMMKGKPEEAIQDLTSTTDRLKDTDKDGILESSDLLSPNDLAEIRKATLEMNMSNLMQNDPVIGGYDPEIVKQHVNEIIEYFPEVHDKIVLLRSLLRRKLETGGDFEPHEIAQQIDIAKKFGG